MAWVAVINDVPIGPYFFNDQFVTSRSYLNMLRNFVVPELRRHNTDPQTIILMQDGPPIHGTEPVRNFLERNFGGWIGRGMGAMIAWRARSPDFNPLNYFVWSYLKNITNRRKARGIAGLKRKVTSAINQMPNNFIRNAIQGFERWIDLCIRTKGGPFEQLLH